VANCPSARGGRRRLTAWLLPRREFKQAPQIFDDVRRHMVDDRFEHPLFLSKNSQGHRNFCSHPGLNVLMGMPFIRSLRIQSLGGRESWPRALTVSSPGERFWLNKILLRGEPACTYMFSIRWGGVQGERLTSRSQHPTRTSPVPF
jgi:hypothetical protein